MILIVVLTVLLLAVVITSRHMSMVPAQRGDRVSERWLIDHLYAYGKRRDL